ncbi:MAG TPA: hypothetical protein VGA55_09025 [Bacteroidota bacterium]
MPAIETFDWFRQHVWPQAGEELRRLLEQQRAYLMNIRNENERRRFVEEIMLEARTLIRSKKI